VVSERKKKSFGVHGVVSTENGGKGWILTMKKFKIGPRDHRKGPTTFKIKKKACVISWWVLVLNRGGLRLKGGTKLDFKRRTTGGTENLVAQTLILQKGQGDQKNSR